MTDPQAFVEISSRTAAELAEKYGFTDTDGTRPSTVRPYFAGRAASAQPVDSESSAVT